MDDREHVELELIYLADQICARVAFARQQNGGEATLERLADIAEYARVECRNTCGIARRALAALGGVR